MRQLSLCLGFLLASFYTYSEETLSSSQIQSIVLGSGCFWGAEKGYASIPGVIEAVSGYADGKQVLPNYSEITLWKNRFNPSNHAEVVKVIFDSTVVSTEGILKHYFESHDPTQINRQGNDLGTQYRSIILTSSELQNKTAKKVLNEFQILLTKSGYGKIVTDIKPLTKFYRAEEYHQDYLVKNPKGYCPDHSTGVRFAVEEVNEPNNAYLLNGKQILIVESEGCPYCERFRETVASNYKGSVPLSFRLSSELDGLTVNSPTEVTPTILFLEEGKEVYRKEGYIGPYSFYKLLGAFKLGNSEAFQVAFEEGTDARFCRQYEIFKNTSDGLFVDKLSGDPLFDTRDRFNSGTGWLSFTKAIEGSIIERMDTSFGMKRIEIRAKTSGIHLGHVFPDGPNGKPRYCINATVLDFQPRKPKA